MASYALAQAQHTPTSSPTTSLDPVLHADGVSLFVRNLPDDVTTTELQQVFGGFGKILKVHLPSPPTKCWKNIYAFVHFEDPEPAKAAMEHLDGKMKLDGAPLELNIRPSRACDWLAMGLEPQQHNRLYFRGFPFSGTMTEDVVALFGRFGRVCHIRTTHDAGSATAAGTVDMESPEAVAAAIAALDGSTHGTNFLRVRWAAMTMAPANPNRPTKSERESGCGLYYTGIPSTVPPAAIAEVFGRFGDVLHAAPSRADGSGVVTMASEQSAKEAVVRLNGSFTWPGADQPMVVVRPYVKRAERSSSSYQGAANSSSGFSILDSKQQQQHAQQGASEGLAVQQQITPRGGSSSSNSSYARGAAPMGPARCNLLVRNLPADFTATQLEQLLGEAAQDFTVYLPSLQAVGWKHLSTGYAFVKFRDARDARRVLEQFDGKLKLGGVPLELYVSPAQASDALAMGLQPQGHSALILQASSPSITTEDVVRALEPFGRVRCIRSTLDGALLVYMDSPEAAAAAVAMALDENSRSTSVCVVGWAEMFLESANCQEPMKLKIHRIRSSASDRCRVQYTGIPHTVSPADIARVFGYSGEVVYVAPELPCEPLSRSADGSGVVVMGSEQAARDAVARFNGSYTWPGAERPLVVQPYVRRAAGSSSSSSSSSAANSYSSNNPSAQQQHAQQVPYAAVPAHWQAIPQGGISNSGSSSALHTYQNQATSYTPLMPQQGHLPHPAALSTGPYQMQAPILSDPGKIPVAWVVDATGRQQPVYRLADGRLLMVTGGTAPQPTRQQLLLSETVPASEQPMQPHPQLFTSLAISSGAVSYDAMQPHPQQPLLPPGLDPQPLLPPGLDPQPQQQLYQGEPSLQQPTLLFQQLPTGQVLVAPSGSHMTPPGPLQFVQLQPAAAPALAPAGCVVPQLAAAGHPMQSGLLTTTPALLGPTGPVVQLDMDAGFSALPAMSASCSVQMVAAQEVVQLQDGFWGLVPGMSG